MKDLVLFVGGRFLKQNDLIEEYATIEVSLKLCGGKGGYSV